MVIIAVSLYLPGHIATMLSRAWFYCTGDETAAAPAAVGRGGSQGAGAVGMRQVEPGKAGGRTNGQDVLDMLGSL